jgi:hypothetical protein
MNFLYDIFINYKWKNDHNRLDSLLNEITPYPAQSNPLNQIIYVPLRELFRKFNSYTHANIDTSLFPQLNLPSNTFYYSKELLNKKIVATHQSPWTENNNFKIPQEWININATLHPKNLPEYTIDSRNISNKNNISDIHENFIDNTYTYRAVILILASNDTSHYKKCRTIWKKYMKNDSNIKIYFVYGKLNESLDDYDSDSDIIFQNIEEGYPISIKKTIEAMKIIQNKIKYDFFIRTNLSTFWDFNKLHLHLNELPSKNCYCGDGPLPNYSNGYYLSGSDTIVTPEMIDSIIKNEHLVDFALIEDAAMGKYFNGILKAPFLTTRICFFEDIKLNEYDRIKNRIIYAKKNNVDHYRVKTLNGNREIIDYSIYKILLKYIYNIDI